MTSPQVVASDYLPPPSAAVVYRALRLDEVEVDAGTGKVRLANNGSITVRPGATAKLPGAHVFAGSKTSRPSQWVSTTRSVDRAAAVFAKDVHPVTGAAYIAAIALPTAAELQQAPSVAVSNPRSSAAAFMKLYPSGEYDGTVQLPGVIDAAAFASSTLAAPEGFPLMAGLGDTGHKFATAHDEVLLGAIDRSGLVVPASRILSVAAVRRDPSGTKVSVDPTAWAQAPATAFSRREVQSRAAFDAEYHAWMRLRYGLSPAAYQRASSSSPQKKKDVDAQQSQAAQGAPAGGLLASAAPASLFGERLKVFSLALAARGVSLDAQSKALGFAGMNGDRDLCSVVEGRSTKSEPAGALRKLAEEFGGGGFAPPAAAAFAPTGSAASSPPATQKGSTPLAAAPAEETKPSMASPLRGQTTTSSPTASSLEWLSQQLALRGVSLNEQSRALGYAGTNGVRDMAKVFEGRSSHCTPATAIGTLERAFAAYLPKNTRDAEPTAAPASKPPERAPQPTQPAAAPAAAPPPWGAFSSAGNTDQLPKPAQDSSPTTRSAGEQLRELSKDLVSRGIPTDKQSNALGYSGLYGDRDMDAVIEGRSTKTTAAEAIPTLRRAFPPSAASVPDGRSAELRKLSQELVGQGISTDEQSKVLGYAGWNGDRDMDAVIEGRSTKASASEAISALRRAFPPATGAVPEDRRAELRKLSQELFSQGVSLNEQSKALGYSGLNGHRDMESVLEGTSMKANIAEAIDLLRRGFPTSEAPAQGRQSAQGSTSAPQQEPQMQTATAAAELQKLSRDLAARGISTDAQTKALGYSGSNGDRDMSKVLEGRSTKASCEEAASILRRAFATGKPTPVERHADPAFGDQAATAIPERRPDEGERLRRLTQELEARGVSLNAQSAALGYCGTNGPRDMGRVIDGRSTKSSAADAMRTLQARFSGSFVSHAAAPAKPHHHAPSGSSSHHREDHRTTSYHHHQPSSFASPSSSSWGAATHHHQAQARPSPAAELRQLTQQLEARGISKSAQSAALGYSGKNGPRDMQAVLDGRSKNVDAASALRALKKL